MAQAAEQAVAPQQMKQLNAEEAVAPPHALQQAQHPSAAQATALPLALQVRWHVTEVLTALLHLLLCALQQRLCFLSSMGVEL